MSDLPPNDLLAQATCAVLRANGEIAGTAWLVSKEGHLLTAGHLLCKELTDTSTSCHDVYEKVQVKFSQDISRNAELTLPAFEREEGIDFALLKLTTMPPNRQPLPISLIRSVRGTFILRGYGESLKDPATGMGNFTGVVDRQGNPDYRLFRLSCKALADQGFSGGAVYSEKEGGGVGAVVAIQVEAGEDALSPTGETVLAMPLYRVAQYWEQLEELAAASPPPPPPPPSSPTSTLSEQAQAALKTCFQRNHTQILAALQAEQHHEANHKLHALYRTFLNPPPDLGTIRSMLAFLRHESSALGHLKMLLQEPTLQRLVRRGGAERRGEYERMVFGGEIALKERCWIGC